MNSRTGGPALAVSGGEDHGEVYARDEVTARAASLAKAGYFGRSLALLDEALRERPRDHDLLYARALTLLDWGRLSEALAGLQAAKEAGFSSFGLFVNLCQVCYACGLMDEAGETALQAIAIDDRQAAGHLGLAVVCQARKRYTEAIERYERGYALAPERVDCLWEIASCLLDQKDATGAETVARRAISTHGDGHAKSWALLGNALAMRRRWDEAMAAFERAEAIEARDNPNGEAFVMHGFQLFWSGRLDAALDLYGRYLPTSTNPGAHAHFGLVLLTVGHLRDAWPYYEFRWTFDRLLAIRPRLGRPEWRGQDLQGRTLLLWAEQGVGDVVQFVRLARAFREKGAIILLHVPERLTEFAKGFRDIDRVVSEPAEIADGFDYHLSLMSASGALGIDLESIPSDVPYIAIDEDRKRHWRQRLQAAGCIRVGLAWAGNPNHEHDHLRSIALARLAPLFGVEGVRFYSLQKETRPYDAGALPPGAELIDLALELVDFRDTAAAIDALDLVIAVDTAVVHIAGALAKPAWVMLQTPPDFRWLTEGDDSPWYPTVRLFRQRLPDEWDEVIADVTEALVATVRAWRAGNASASSLLPVATQARRVAAIPQPSISPLCGITDTRYGIVQYLRREETLARSLEFYGEWLQPQLDLVATRLKSGSVVLEAGSSIGAHTLALARVVGATGAVFAYEPEPMRARVLFQNLQMNQLRSQVTIMERRLVGSSASTEVPSADAAAGKQADACDTVDDLALNRLDLLKINCSRAAGDILQGAADALWRLRPLLVIASEREHFDALAARVESFGYRCWRSITPYFSAANHSCRKDDVFGGREALALIGVPEEVEPMASLGAHEEVSTSRGSLRSAPAKRADRDDTGPGSALSWLLRGIGRAFSFERDSQGPGRVEPFQPDPADVQRYSLAADLLMRGDYERGFDLYESRFDALPEHAAPARKFARSLGLNRRWSGEPLSRRTVVIWTEQGFGDSLMMFRYLPLLKAAGAEKVMVVCERELVRLLEIQLAVDHVLSGNDTLTSDDYDLHCPVMSLPHCFRTTLATVPHDVPYLAVPGELVDRWRKRLGGAGALKIGLAWAGGEMLEADSRRSIPLATFEHLFRVPGVQFISLQKDRRLDEARTALPLGDWMSECNDFLDTAALIGALDLVIAVDTAVAHLAGALGKNVWLLNRFGSEWRWGHGVARSIWYPTMTIFNQRNPERWEDIIDDITLELDRAAGAQSPLKPGAV